MALSLSLLPLIASAEQSESIPFVPADDRQTHTGPRESVREPQAVNDSNPPSLIAAAEEPTQDQAPFTSNAPFAVEVVDDSTHRGIPLVELHTTTNQTYVTDSHGYVAIDDPALFNRRVYFHVSSHGYEVPKDGFGFRGKVLDVVPGKESRISMKRINIAQRLYRITGAGIYRDSIKLNKDAPIDRPLLNALVTGQDSVQAALMNDRIFWFWGDTSRLAYPLGQFNTSGAVSRLPRAGGLDPDQGINLDYVTDGSGFSRPMFKRENGVLIWVHGVFVVGDERGQPRIVTHFSRRKNLQNQLSHGIAVLNEDRMVFEPIVALDQAESLYPRGHSFRHRENRKNYVYFADPYAMIRVPATWDSVIDPDQYEAFTPLKADSEVVAPDNLQRDGRGKLVYAWKKNTPPLDVHQHQEWIDERVIEPKENWFHTVDAKSQKPIVLHRGSIHWNDYRQRWIMIAHQSGGTSSYLGEVWYAESQRPEGPFPEAIKIVTHNNYSFYNVTHHDFFDKEEGQLIYFEGTYTNSFSKSETRTPWYDYNQIMYQLDLSDPRLQAAFQNE